MKRVGVSELRKLNNEALRNLREPLEVCNRLEPLSVLFPFQQYMDLQEAYRLAEQVCEALQNGGV
jgi:hypothetical protein